VIGVDRENCLQMSLALLDESRFFAPLGHVPLRIGRIFELGQKGFILLVELGLDDDALDGTIGQGQLQARRDAHLKRLSPFAIGVELLPFDLAARFEDEYLRRGGPGAYSCRKKKQSAKRQTHERPAHRGLVSQTAPAGAGPDNYACRSSDLTKYRPLFFKKRHETCYIPGRLMLPAGNRRLSVKILRIST
jgi:hypothetical protein